MKINFILPTRTKRPIGGFMVMYEYANRLAEKGYNITILHRRARFQRYSRFLYPIVRTLKEIEDSFTPNWFNFHKSCKIKYIRDINDKEIPDANITIYTWWELGFQVCELSDSKGIKLNLIQGYEIWKGDIPNLHLSYDLKNVHNIVISSYLKRIVSQHTQKESLLLYNAVNTTKFKMTTPVESRNPKQVCMLYHRLLLKGSRYGVEALVLAKEKMPDLQAIIFGMENRPSELPPWIEYFKNPENLCGIYNRSSIFFSNSIQEGWGLPSVEAMTCGCALVCTNIGGHLDYANDQTAILVRPEQAEEMSNAIIYLIENQEKRFFLSANGKVIVKQYTWEKSVQVLDEYLQDLVRRKGSFNKNKE